MKLINLTIDNFFRNPFRWGRLNPNKINDRKRFGFIYFKDFDPFTDKNLVILFFYFWYFEKKFLFRINK